MAGDHELVQKVYKELPRVAAKPRDFGQDGFPQKQFSTFLEPGA